MIKMQPEMAASAASRWSNNKCSHASGFGYWGTIHGNRTSVLDFPFKEILELLQNSFPER